MTGEVNLFGVFLHPLLVAAILAFPLGEMVSWVLGRAGLYRFIWHRGLFDVALAVVIWALLAALIAGGPLPSPFPLPHPLR